MSFLALFGAAFVLGGCFLVGDTCFHPITSTLPLAAARPPLPPDPGIPRGSCGKWVRFAGQQYTDSSDIGLQAEDWSLTEANLSEIGRAEGATVVAGPFSSDVVYAVDGIDPAEAVAMLRRDEAGGGILVLVASPMGPPGELCQYLRDPPPDSATMCDRATESP